jgi:mRNA interferase RelE/StbE
LKTLFELQFLPGVLKEWNSLDKAIRRQFARKLQKILAEPRVPSMRLSKHKDCYRIKLRAAGYRLIYHVDGKRIIVTVLRVARREKDEAYENIEGRLAELGF